MKLLTLVALAVSVATAQQKVIPPLSNSGTGNPLSLQVPLSPIYLPAQTAYVGLPNAVGPFKLSQLSAGGAPTVATGSAGALTGAYKYCVTFTDLFAGETICGTVSATVNPSSQMVSLTAIPLGAVGTTTRKIYRTQASGVYYQFLATIQDNTTTTYTDNAADSTLGSPVHSYNTSGDIQAGTQLMFSTVTGCTLIGLRSDAFDYCAGLTDATVMGNVTNNVSNANKLLMGRLYVVAQPPTTFAGTPSSSGGSPGIPAGTYYYKLCAADGAGHNTCATELGPYTLTGTTSSVAFTWVNPTPPQFFLQLFRGTSPGGENVKADIFSGTSFTDNGSNVTTSARPGSTAPQLWTDTTGAHAQMPFDTTTWMQASALNMSQGTKFTASGCSNGTLVGGSMAGSLVSGTTGTCTVTVTYGANKQATNGSNCTIHDLTTPADVLTITAESTTAFTFTGTTVSGDVIKFACFGY